MRQLLVERDLHQSGPIQMSTPQRKPSRSRKNNNSRDRRSSRPKKDEDFSSPPEEVRAELISEDELAKEAKRREKQQPLLKRIAKAMNKEADDTFKELIINSEPLERRMAFLEDGVLQKFEVEKTDQEQMVGAIFKGKIQNHEPGIKAAFVDIGLPKNAFLHYWDIVQQGLGEDIDALEDDDLPDDDIDDEDDDHYEGHPENLKDPGEDLDEEDREDLSDVDDDLAVDDADLDSDDDEEEEDDSQEDDLEEESDEDNPDFENEEAVASENSHEEKAENPEKSDDSDEKSSEKPGSANKQGKSPRQAKGKGKPDDNKQGNGRNKNRRHKNKAKQSNRRQSRQQTPPPDEIIAKHPIGSEIIVQITKAQIGTKGPRTTTNLAIPGRFMVLMPYSPQSGISRKIEDREERKRLKVILSKLEIPKTMGVIIRTAGQGKRLRYFERDLAMLVKMWEEVEEKINKTGAHGLVYREPNIIGRTVRDFLTEDIDRVLIDNKEDFDTIQSEVAKISRSSKSKVTLFKDDIPIFERFNIERQIEQTFARCVPLPSGGEIVIEETEALTAIDVNTGGHRIDSASGKNFILDVNLEAAREVARQIRLRNIGGLIIVDFIDMKRRGDRNNVFHTMRRCMDHDRARSHVLPISQLGILQMTRQRHHESNYSTMFEPCPYCRGRGIVKSSRTVSVEIQRKITSIVRRVRSRNNDNQELHLRVTLHPENLERLRTEDEDRLVVIENEHGVKLSFRADPGFHVENFNIVNAETNEELH
jgi:ribonuclease G